MLSPSLLLHMHTRTILQVVRQTSCGNSKMLLLYLSLTCRQTMAVSLPNTLIYILRRTISFTSIHIHARQSRTLKWRDLTGLFPTLSLAETGACLLMILKGLTKSSWNGSCGTTPDVHTGRLVLFLL